MAMLMRILWSSIHLVKSHYYTSQNALDFLRKSPLTGVTQNSVVLVYTILHSVKQSSPHGDCILLSHTTEDGENTIPGITLQNSSFIDSIAEH